MTGGQRKNGATGACACSFTIGYAGYGARGVFAFERSSTQQGRIGIKAIIPIKIRNGACQQSILRRKASILILRCFFRHVYGTRHEPCKNVRVHVGRRNGGRPLANKNAQADIFTFGARDIFQLAKSYLDLSGCIADIYCVSRVSAGLDGLGNEIMCAIKRFLWVQHSPA